MSHSSNFLEMAGLVTDAAVVAALLMGLWLAMQRTKLAWPTRVRTFCVIAAILLLWYGAISLIGAMGMLRATPDVKFPALPLAVFPPIAIGLWLIFRSKIMAEIIDATPLTWLVSIQAYRVVGVTFLVLMAAGLLPPQFALPAGSGDIVVGLLALPVAWAVGTGTRPAIAAAYIWNMLGLLDFIVALSTGFLSSPGRFQMLALDHPNLLASAYPLVMIPAWLVPLSSILHGVCLWKLRRGDRPAARRAAAPEPWAGRPQEIIAPTGST
jgi:hypothetical protein